MFNHGTAPRLGWPLYFQIPPFQEQLLCNLNQGREEKVEIQDESLVASYPRTACTGREHQGTECLVDLRRCQTAAAVHPPDQNSEESRSEIVNKQIHGNVRIRCLQLRNLSLAFPSYHCTMLRFALRDSGSERISPFHCEAGLTDLRRIRGGNAGELRAHVVDDVEVAVRPVVISQTQIGTDRLRV